MVFLPTPSFGVPLLELTLWGSLGSVEGLSNLLENDSKDPSDCPST